MLLLAGTGMPQQSKQPTTGAMSQSTTRLLTCFRCHNTVNCRVNIPPGNPNNQNQPHLEKSETTLKAKVNHVSAINSSNQKQSVLDSILPGYKLALDILEIRIPPPEFYEEQDRIFCAKYKYKYKFGLVERGLQIVQGR